jgi:hypothetical protein
MEAQFPISPSTSAAPSPADSTQANCSPYGELVDRISPEKLALLMQKHNRQSVPIRDDDRFFRALLDGLDASGAVVDLKTDLEVILESTFSRLNEETLGMDGRCRSVGPQIRLAMPDSSLTLGQANSLTEGVRYPTTIHGNAHLLFAVADIVTKRHSDAVDEPFPDRKIEIDAFGDVDEPVLAQPQGLSQTYPLAAAGAGLQPAPRKQRRRSASAREPIRTGWKTKLSGKPKEKSKAISKIRKSERIASRKSSMAS